MRGSMKKQVSKGAKKPATSKKGAVAPAKKQTKKIEVKKSIAPKTVVKTKAKPLSPAI